MARKQYWQRAEEFFAETNFSYNEFTHMWEKKTSGAMLYADYSVVVNGIIINVIPIDVIKDANHIVPRLVEAADIDVSAKLCTTLIFKGNEGMNNLREILE